MLGEHTIFISCCHFCSLCTLGQTFTVCQCPFSILAIALYVASSKTDIETGYLLNLGLGTHLFVKVPSPGDSEVTFSVFESSYPLLLPV